MSTSNDGVSRFVANTIYAPVEFKGPVLLPGGVGAISCTSLTATGAVSAGTALSGASLAVVGAATAASLVTTGAITAGTDVICANYSSLGSELTLTSGLGVYLGGALVNQDAGNPPAALVLADIPFCASYLVTAPRAFVLPAGSPQGFRATFFIAANVVVTFESPDTVVRNIRNTNGAIAFAELAAGTATPNLGENAFIQVTSCNGSYVVMSFDV